MLFVSSLSSASSATATYRPAMAEQGPTLLSLPMEIREHIFGYVLHHEHQSFRVVGTNGVPWTKIQIDSKVINGKDLTTWNVFLQHPHWPHAPLLLCSRQIALEISTIQHRLRNAARAPNPKATGCAKRVLEAYFVEPDQTVYLTWIGPSWTACSHSSVELHLNGNTQWCFDRRSSFGCAYSPARVVHQYLLNRELRHAIATGNAKGRLDISRLNIEVESSQDCLPQRDASVRALAPSSLFGRAVAAHSYLKHFDNCQSSYSVKWEPLEVKVHSRDAPGLSYVYECRSLME